jgi:epoxyqueuosine reductase
MREISFKTILKLANDLDLSIVGAINADRLSSEEERFRSWLDQGFGAEMGYLHRAAEIGFAPDLIFPGARSVICLAVHYDYAPHPTCPPGYGRVARYAWGRDYHKVLPRQLRRLVSAIEGELGQSIKARIISDAAPIHERAFAARAGLGFRGKNSLLIRPGLGSMFLLAEIISDLEITERPLPQAAATIGKGCGSCFQCGTECPTGAIVAPGIIDSRRCISYLTIEKRGILSVPEREMIGEWLFGCDRCQDICPFNFTGIKQSKTAAIPELSAQSGIGPLLELRSLLQIADQEEFSKRFAGTALTRAKRTGLLRNAAVVAANMEAFELIEDLELSALKDPDPVVRTHSLWAFFKLAKKSRIGGVEKILARAKDDSSELVSAEAQELLQQLKFN